MTRFGPQLLLCRPESITDPLLLRRYEAMLDADERARLGRFRFERDAHTFLVAHALVRTALSECAPLRPGDWRFERNQFGRPEIAQATGTSTLRFNLSHCRGLVACLITHETDAGVDVEEVRSSSDWLSIAASYFSRTELQAMTRLPAPLVESRFFELWTLKESYIKARGMGLALPLDKFSFLLQGRAIRIRFDPDLADDPACWSFALLKPTPFHILATAERSGSGKIACKATPHWFVPLVGVEAPVAFEVIAVSDP